MSSAGEEEPMGVGVPVVEAFGVGAVGCGEGFGLLCVEVVDVEVGFGVVYGEASVVGEAVDDESSVVGGSGE